MAAASVSGSYDGAQRAFHWAMAAIILPAIVLGTSAALMPRGALRGDLLMVHKSLGMTALVLAVLRGAYRLFAGAPPYARPLAPLTQAAAHAAHFALYVLMVALPVAGYLDSAAAGRDVPWFGLFAWPNVAPQDRALEHLAGGAHFWLAWAIGGVLALHFAAVAWHVFVKRDEVFSRMWPSRAPRDANEADGSGGASISGVGGSML
jgi:cytochrome b561